MVMLRKIIGSYHMKNKILFSLSLMTILFVTGCDTGSGENSNSTAVNEYKKITGTVNSVLDGDTLKISTNNETIRLACIDAPEDGQEYSNIAKKALESSVNGYDVEIKYTERDKYGRVIGFVSANRNINLEQVRQGNAWVYRNNCNICEYYNAEVYARNNKLGLWASNNPVPPWEWRKYGDDAKKMDWTYLYNDRCPSNGSTNGSGSSEGSRCGSKKYCSQMNSCSEARYYYEQCGLNRLDGDNDGVPCESLCQ